MKVTLTHKRTKEQKVINVSYVWDREDKYLVLSDDIEKKKYTANTMRGDFDSACVADLLMSFCEKVLGWEVWQQDTPGGWSRSLVTWSSNARKPNRACHNDDFYEFYKKNYKLVSHADTGLHY